MEDFRLLLNEIDAMKQHGRIRVGALTMLKTVGSCREELRHIARETGKDLQENRSWLY